MTKWRQTWILAGAALLLLVFILVHERPGSPATSVPRAPSLLPPGCNAAAINAVQVRRASRPLLGAERVGEAWKLNEPFSYPASGARVEAMLYLIQKAEVRALLSPADLAARGQKAADFGLEPPEAVVVLHYQTNRVEIHWGTNTPAGDQVYARVAGMPDVFVVGAEVAASLPRSVNEWREGSLFTLLPQSFDHLALSRASGGFLLACDTTNHLWRLARPPHRADPLKVGALINTLMDVRVLGFVTDNPNADLAGYGLLTPEMEVAFSQGTNVLQRVQFGRSPTNDATRVYARRSSHTNIVLVAKTILDTLSVPVADLRDRRLVVLPPQVDTLEVRAEEPFTLRRQTNGLWTTGDGVVADVPFMRFWLEHLSNLRAVEFVKDVVTDFSLYGLAVPARQYLFKTTVTNAAGPTNLVVAQLDFGTNGAGDVFARRADEDSVCSIKFIDYHRMPWAPWQLRDHQVWSFGTNDVARVIVRQAGLVRTLVRNERHEWFSGSDTAPLPNSWALEETLFRLGDLRAVSWAARGETNRAALGFGPGGHQITIELKGGDKPQALTLEFGGASPAGLAYAATMVEGQWWVFEFPWPLYPDVKRELGAVP